MGLPVLILGESGTGKSASLRNFKDDEVAVINVASKPLPFKNKITTINTDSYGTIKTKINAMVDQGYKRIVIDDAQYLMANEFMRRATEKGYDKFTEIAQNFWSLVNSITVLPEQTIVYFLAHIERDQNGNEKVKTIGKLLDEKITVEGMFTIVLKTNVTDGVYSFLTQNSGHDTVKSPMGMFPTYAIENDLKYVDEKIRNYYEIGDYLPDEEIAKIEDEVKQEDIQPEKPKKRRGRKAEEPVEGVKDELPEELPKRKKREVAKPEPVEEDLPFTMDEPEEKDPVLDEFGPVEEAVKSEEAPRRRRRRS